VSSYDASGTATAASRARALAGSCHPEPVVAVTSIATALAVAAGGRWWLVLLAFLAGQLSVGWSNDYIDRDRDKAAARSDKPVAAGLVADRVVGISALVALVLCVPLSLLLGWRAGVAHLVAVAFAWGYNLVFKSSVLSPLPYVVAFGLVPSVVTLSVDGTMAPAWATAGGALLGASAHLTNTLPDLAEDVRLGVRGLPHRLGRRWSLLLAVVLLAAACLTLALGPPGGVGAVAWVLLGVAALAIGGIVVVAAGRAQSRDAFRLVVLTAVVAVALLVVQGDQLV
jgi:4-hydroxybenzoate polyprenyltransferase